MTYHPEIFREYDVRGIAGVDLTPQLAYALGRAFAERVKAHVARAHPSRQGPVTVAVGRDARLSGPALMRALEAGFHAEGVHTLNLGLAATPLVYFALHQPLIDGRACDAGVAVTGSHNPPEWNGFKLCVGTQALYGEALQELSAEVGALLAALEPLSVEQLTPTPQQRTDLDLTPSYASTLASRLQFGSRRLKVVVDAGSGALGPAALALYAHLNLEVLPLYCEPDGRFPHHHPDPTVEENLADLKRVVLAEGADLGVAFDGDGDRVGVVDERGRVLWGDQLMVFFARDILKRAPGARIIGEVKCSQVLYDEVKAAGGVAEMWRVGHSLIKARMKETGAPLAGEMSGHIFFADRFEGYDDAAYVGARLLELLSHSTESLSAWLDALPHTYTTPELRVTCPDQHKRAVIERAAAHFGARYEVVSVDGVRVLFEGGWGLMRASNTQPVLVLRFEANTREALEAQREELMGWLTAEAPEVTLESKKH